MSSAVILNSISDSFSVKFFSLTYVGCMHITLGWWLFACSSFVFFSFLPFFRLCAKARSFGWNTMYHIKRLYQWFLGNLLGETILKSDIVVCRQSQKPKINIEKEKKKNTDHQNKNEKKKTDENCETNSSFIQITWMMLLSLKLARTCASGEWKDKIKEYRRKKSVQTLERKKSQY